jgi:cell division protein FtsB
LAARVVVPSLALVCVLIVLGYAVFPTRTWLDQRTAIADLEATAAELEAENADLAARFTLLGTDAEIERIARIEHGLVMPGEEAFAILPLAPEPVRLPPAWPFVDLADALGG